jgi:hypothetical protein
MKGEIKKGLEFFRIFSNQPLDPLLHKEGELVGGAER